MTAIPPEYLNQIVTGDARELAQRIPDESVDLIFTDPPYPKEHDHVFYEMGEYSPRILKPGGSLITLCGHYQLPLVIDAMKRLDFFWTCCLWQPGQSGLIWHKSIMAKWKPALWFSKGSPVENVNRWFMDGVEGSQSKDYHIWGQPVSWAMWIDRIKAEIILDPFCGGGTVPAVCKMLGRNYIAFEIDPDVAERARERVRNTQPPLFVLQPEQSVMEFEA